MKAKAVSALRSKRGLRPGLQEAEPQVVGLTPQTTNDRRTDTMKTYLLRQLKAVESQNVRRRRAGVNPVAAGGRASKRLASCLP